MIFTPETFTQDSTEVLGRYIGADSLWLPTLNIIYVAEGTGNVQLIQSKPSVDWRFPEGAPRIADIQPMDLASMVKASARRTAQLRATASFGPSAEISEQHAVTIQPFTHTRNARMDKLDRKTWPNAVGRVDIPTVAVVHGLGHDPRQKYNQMSQEPEQALEILEHDFRRLGSPIVERAHDALAASMPYIQYLVSTLV